MVDINREEDRKALVGTATALILLLILLMILGLNACSDEEQDLEPSGGVSVSLGNPDDGGPDNSAAEQEEAYEEPIEEPVEEVVEEAEPESQVTTDEADAPPVQETKPTTKPSTTPSKTTPKETPTEPVKKPTKPARKPNAKDMWGKEKTGAGKNGTSDDRGGYKGRPDGTPDGAPDGQGQGDQGTGPDAGPPGNGISGGINGFGVLKQVQPQTGVQAKGVIRLKVCVDANGNVIPSSIKYAPNRDPNTSTNLELRKRAISAMKQFKFKNKTGSAGGCGYFSFNFKLQ